MRVSFLSQYFWPEETATAEMLSGVAFSAVAIHFSYNAGSLASSPILASTTGTDSSMCLSRRCSTEAL